jgi:hypothetical protein
MSAPPIGMMSVTPTTIDTSTISQNRKALSVRTKRNSRSSSAPPSAMFTMWRCGSRIGLPPMRPESLRKAITLPENVIAPMATPSPISTRLAFLIEPIAPMPNAAGA